MATTREGENAEPENAVRERLALRESEERFRATFENAAVGIAHVATDGRWLRVNNRLCEIVGYTRDELLERTFQDITHPEDLDTDLALMRRLLAGELPHYSMEKRYYHKTGKIVFVSLTVSLVRTIDGAPDYLISIIEDITARKRAEEAHRQGDAIRVARLAASLDAIITIDDQGLVFEWSRSAEQMFGYSRDQAVGREMAELIIPPRLREAHRQGMERFHRTGEGPLLSKLIELPAIRANGAEFPAEVSITPIPLEGRTLFTGFIRDISERKQRRMADAHLAAIVASSGDAIMSFSLEDNVLSWNPAAERLFGYRGEEVSGRPLTMIFPEEKAEEARGEFDMVREGQSVTFETVARRKDGANLEISINAAPIRSGDGMIVAVSAIMRDMTQQNALRRVQRLESLGLLTGGIAHDFNNILTVVSGNLELFEARHSRDADLDLLHEAQAATAMGTRLVDRLLKFSRRAPLEPTIIKLSDQVLDLADLLRRTLGESIDLNIMLAPDLWPTRVDPGEMENVVLNLAINAREAMPEGGKLIIETRNMRLDQPTLRDLRAGDYVVLSVSDSGKGMPPEVLQHVFEPFFTTREPGKGTGLGLSSTYGFAKQSGGQVSIYSEVGRGTTVNVYLPRHGAETKPQPAISLGDDVFEGAGGETILVVEDNPGAALGRPAAQGARL